MDEKSTSPEVRFEFGENWNRFLSVLDESSILEAEDSLKKALNISSLKGKSFLDAGSGSGLFSLAAYRLGADRVHSFDYDPQSVACTRELKRRFFPNAENWSIEQGSLLDKEYLDQLPNFDVVYSWGVLHHTGDMWRAMENLVPKIEKNGSIYISIYNDQGLKSQLWKKIKRLYNVFPPPLRILILVPVIIKRWVPLFIWDLCKGTPFKRWIDYGKNRRGMSAWHDLIDWVGGYPFEVARPEEIFEFFYHRDFNLSSLATMSGGHGCNQFVFRKK
ncbi:MAG: methyltransferase domain-containing protein [Nitrospinota bacterium]